MSRNLSNTEVVFMCNDDEHGKCPLSISNWITIIENEISNNTKEKSESLMISVISLIFVGFISLMTIKMFQENVKLLNKINEVSNFNASSIFNETCLVSTINWSFYNSIKVGDNFINVVNMLIAAFFIFMVYLFINESEYRGPYRESITSLRCRIISGELNTPNKIQDAYLQIKKTDKSFISAMCTRMEHYKN